MHDSSTTSTRGTRRITPSAWLPLAIIPVSAWALTAGRWPAWAVMWILAMSLFTGCKWLSYASTTVGDVPRWRHWAFLIAWPGMDAQAFLTPQREHVPPPTAGEWLRASCAVIAGCALCWLGVRAAANLSDLAQGWIGMVGLVLLLHFGTFHLLSCCWRQAGIAAHPLMDRPLAATSLGEFWGRRWNTAFRDLTHRFIFAPLRERWGPRVALAVGFLVSGVVHDVVISLPTRSGFGLPTLFFLIHGAAVLGERSRFGRRLGLGSGGVGWLYTMTVLIAPLGLLFHPPFVRQVILPFLDLIAAR